MYTVTFAGLTFPFVGRTFAAVVAAAVGFPAARFLNCKKRKVLFNFWAVLVFILLFPIGFSNLCVAHIHPSVFSQLSFFSLCPSFSILYKTCPSFTLFYSGNPLHFICRHLEKSRQANACLFGWLMTQNVSEPVGLKRGKKSKRKKLMIKWWKRLKMSNFLLCILDTGFLNSTWIFSFIPAPNWFHFQELLRVFPAKPWIAQTRNAHHSSCSSFQFPHLEVNKQEKEAEKTLISTWVFWKNKKIKAKVISLLKVSFSSSFSCLFLFTDRIKLVLLLF